MLSFLKKLAGADGVITYADFVRAALYAPEVGYYAKNKKLIGRAAETDFYTAESLGAVFAKLVVEAAQNLLATENPKDFAFVEIGAEQDGGILQKIPHPFAETRTIKLGGNLDIPAKAIVFANEVLDAQPFHRLVFHQGQWREKGVRIIGGKLEEILLEQPDEAISNIIKILPPTALEGYQLDLPLGAESLLGQIAKKNWSGLFLTFDYGKSWDELALSCPQGTARAYHKHRQKADLLDHPGEQDLTCHVCWDRLAGILRTNKFDPASVETQEAFFVRHAGKTIAEIIETRPGKFDSNRQSLREIIHPARMGDKFQALWALRK